MGRDQHCHWGSTAILMENIIRREREKRGWTQAALAVRLGVSRQTVNAIETGKYDPSLPLAFRIARQFDHPIEGLFTPDDQ
jgi:putative transcriptional regulator